MLVMFFVLDFVVPCSDLVVSIEEDPEQMIFVFADSEAAIQAKKAAAEMMAEIIEEMERQAALEAFLQKLEDEKAAAATGTSFKRHTPNIDKDLSRFSSSKPKTKVKAITPDIVIKAVPSRRYLEDLVRVCW